MNLLIKRLLRESLSKQNTIVYRCIDGEYKTDFNGIEYFAINKNYAKSFGDTCYKFTLNLNNSKILNLQKWNNLYTEKTGLNGNKYNRVQGIFVIGEESINSSYSEPLSRFSQVFPNDVVEGFINEFNTCDVIYGEDAGYPNEFVFAVKNKNIISNIYPQNY